MFANRLPKLLVLVLLAGAVTACGSGGSATPKSSGPASPSAQAAVDAKSAATGDIPDSQVYLTFHDAPAGYTIQYPEGWTQQGGGRDIRFADKDNSIRVVVASGAPPTPATVAAGLARLAASTPTLRAGAPRTIAAKHGAAILVSYSMAGTADPVTGKVPVLLVDRYVYSRGGRVATIDLASPKGVDNVDAYKLIGQGFQWR